MPIGLVPRSTTVISKFLLLGGQRSCYFGTSRPLMPPTPPPEKKWFYKEVWAAIYPKVEKFTTKRLSTGGASQKPESTPAVTLKDLPVPLTSNSTGTWSQRLAMVRDRGFKLAEKYGLRDKLDMAFQQYCRFVAAVKDFFYQKRYKQMGSLLDGGLKSLEDKIRLTREGRKVGCDDGNRSVCDGGKHDGGSDVRLEGAEKGKDEGNIVAKLRFKPEEKP